MDLIEEINAARRELISEINETFGQLIRKVQESEQYKNAANEQGGQTPEPFVFEVEYYLTEKSATFKGKKPTSIIFGDEEPILVRTWKMVVEEILQRCIADRDDYQKLMNLRGKISGRDRVLLSDKKEGMRSPYEISPKLYMETHYDTETLIKVLLTRILDAIQYDYKDIKVTIRAGR